MSYIYIYIYKVNYVFPESYMAHFVYPSKIRYKWHASFFFFFFVGEKYTWYAD